MGGREEPYDTGVSRTILWEPGGEIPPGDSTLKLELLRYLYDCQSLTFRIATLLV